MDVGDLRSICTGLEGVTEDIKWGQDLCFVLSGKMFCVTPLSGPFSVSLKVGEEEFHELCATPGIVPAPYVARYHWILIENPLRFKPKEWEHYIRQSYELVKAKLPAKARGIKKKSK